MKHSDTKKTGGILSSKWFYAVLAFCLMASGVASWIAVESTVQKPAPSPSSSITGDTQVNRPQSDVQKPDETQKPSILPPGSEAETEEHPQSSSSKPQSSVTESIGLFVMPANGDIFNIFSGGQLVKSVTMGDWRTHDGIDIDCEDDRQVFAAGAGVVTAVREDPLWGTCIEITHDGGIVTYYSSLSNDTAVSKGQKVQPGDLIGTASDSAAVEVLEPIHVHFAAKRDGQWIDPTTLLANDK